jgi:DNA-binding YbaB/EbfC family protein
LWLARPAAARLEFDPSEITTLFPNIAMNIAKMMKQAQQMQSNMQTVQAELAARTVDASVAGKVHVTANGAGDVLSIRIDPSVVNAEDVEMLEDLVLTGVRQAIAKGRDMAAEEMKKVTAGMGLPPGMGF